MALAAGTTAVMTAATMAATTGRGDDGGIRVDHVMGLFRLFWIPVGVSAADGAYVRYRHEEMLDILALESHRAGALAVLPVVRPQIAGEMKRRTAAAEQRLAEGAVGAAELDRLQARPAVAGEQQAHVAVTHHLSAHDRRSVTAKRGSGLPLPKAPAFPPSAPARASRPRRDGAVDLQQSTTAAGRAAIRCSGTWRDRRPVRPPR
jgi:hypothetical protein